MVPSLGTNLEATIQNGETRLAYENRRFEFKYYENAYPLNAETYITVLQAGRVKNPELTKLRSEARKLIQLKDSEPYSERWKDFLINLGDQKISAHIDHCLRKVNSNHDLLQKIAEGQFYRLCNWRETDTIINYRRFFTVNGLISTNMQDKTVFELFHQLMASLVDDRIFRGLRVDHIDGLYDPAAYLQQLKELAGNQTYVVVEKILEPGEALPQEWKTEGTTGYDFLSLVNGLFTNIKR